MYEHKDYSVKLAALTDAADAANLQLTQTYRELVSFTEVAHEAYGDLQVAYAVSQNIIAQGKQTNSTLGHQLCDSVKRIAELETQNNTLKARLSVKVSEAHSDFSARAHADEALIAKNTQLSVKLSSVEHQLKLKTAEVDRFIAQVRELSTRKITEPGKSLDDTVRFDGFTSTLTTDIPAPVGDSNSSGNAEHSSTAAPYGSYAHTVHANEGYGLSYKSELKADILYKPRSPAGVDTSVIQHWYSVPAVPQTQAVPDPMQPDLSGNTLKHALQDVNLAENSNSKKDDEFAVISLSVVGGQYASLLEYMPVDSVLFYPVKLVGYSHKWDSDANVVYYTKDTLKALIAQNKHLGIKQLYVIGPTNMDNDESIGFTHRLRLKVIYDDRSVISADVPYWFAQFARELACDVSPIHYCATYQTLPIPGETKNDNL